MADWVNNGSIRDISDLAKDSLAPTSQHGGNQVWQNTAMTAPGGASGDLGNDLDEAVVVKAPVIDMQPVIKPGTDGKPSARTGSGHTASEPSWGKTTSPNVVREK
jgi:hypothetical protein